MKIETFPDGSTIETDIASGNRTVCGVLAHAEYFSRLRSEQITALEMNAKRKARKDGIPWKQAKHVFLAFISNS